MSLKKQIIIDASIEKVHQAVSDFNTWGKWSPWLICEDGVKVEVNSNADFYSWEGKRVGSGNMKIVNNTPERVDYDLTFLKPFKSTAKVSFLLEENENGTIANWTMESKLPFFMFFMKKKMEVFVGLDYSRGLKMLKDFVEKGKVESSLEFVGKKAYKGGDFIGIRTKTTVESIGKSMAEDIQNLMRFVNSNSIELNGKQFSQYHKFDFVTGEAEYTSGVIVNEIPENLDSKFVSGNLKEVPVNIVRHTGRYDHIGNAWSAQIMMERNKEFKQLKGYHPIEIYHNSPMDTEPENLITDICFAIKK